MERIADIKQQVIEHIDHCFARTESAANLYAWALTPPIFANPKELDNSEDWMSSNALALMVALADAAADHSAIEHGLREARRFLSGEEPFPEDRWPTGLLKS